MIGRRRGGIAFIGRRDRPLRIGDSGRSSISCRGLRVGRGCFCRRRLTWRQGGGLHIRATTTRGDAVGNKIRPAGIDRGFDQLRALKDQTAVNLHQRRTGVELFPGVAATGNAAHANDGDGAVQRVGQAANHPGGAPLQRRTGQAAILGGLRNMLHAIARQRGVGGDHAVDFLGQQHLGNVVNCLIFQIRGELDHQRHIAAMLLGQLQLAHLQAAQQLGQRGRALQVAQVFGVGRRDIDGDVAGVQIHLVQAGEVVVHRALHRRERVLADIDAEHALEP